MKSRLRSVALAACFTILASSPARAAEAPALSEEIAVEIVNLDVHVTGKDGKPVLDLPREAFRLYEDGKEVEITHFARVPVAAGRGEQTGAATGADVAPFAGRQFAVFFDEAQVGDHSRTPLLEALGRTFVASLQPADSVEIVRFDGAETHRILERTTDRSRVATALSELGGFSPRRLAASAERRTFVESLEMEIKPGAAPDLSPCLNVGQIVRAYADLIRHDVEASASALLRYSSRLANLPGRHLLLHVSDGIPMLAGGDLYQYAFDMCGGDAMFQGVPGGFINVHGGDGDYELDRFDPAKARLEFADYLMAPLWSEVAARINAMGVKVYPIQAGASHTLLPLRDEVGILPTATVSMIEQNPVDTLQLIAHETGGLLLRGPRGIESEIERLVGDFGGYYSLAFAPAQGRPSALRKLEVRVDRPGVELRHQRSYRTQSRDERIVGQLVDLFETDRIDNPLGVRVGTRRPDATKPQRLQVVVPFERLTMIEGAGGTPEGRFTVFLAVRDERGRSGGVRQRSIAASRPDPSTRAFTYEIELTQLEGEVAVGVVDDYSGTIGFAKERLRAQ